MRRTHEPALPPVRDEHLPLPLHASRKSRPMKTTLNRLLGHFGFECRRISLPHDRVLDSFPDLSEIERNIVRTVQPYTMVSIERIVNVILAVKYVVQHRVPGDIVECGVWRGGCTMAAALTLKSLGDTTRRLYLYDTFEGMSEPTETDVSFDGHRASTLLAKDPRGTGTWCAASLEDVRVNLFSTGYPASQIEFVPGKVEETLARVTPTIVGLLRLDTDWYESTQSELTHLYPLLQPGGVLIIDDYGHWQGARRAVDEYVARLPHPTYLHRIDYTGRILIKTGP